MQVTEHDNIAALQRLAKQERDGRVRTRLRGIILARQGKSASAIGEVLGVAERTVRAWVHQYNEDGVAGLQEQPGRGRPMRLDEVARERFCARLDAGAQSSDKVCSLRGVDLVEILEVEFGVSYSTSGIYRLLDRLGYSCLMPRPQHRKADPAAQEEFKKNGDNNPAPHSRNEFSISFNADRSLVRG